MSMLVLACAVAACGSRHALSCRFGREQVVFRSSGSSFDGVALSDGPHGPTAFFSDASGLFAARLDAQGRVSGSALRVGPRCEGGLAALADGDAVELACLRPARGAEPGAAVSLYVLNASLQLSSQRDFGVARRLSQGIALARSARGLYCAWQDASVGEARVWVAALTAAAPAPRVVSDLRYRAGAPSLCAHAGGVFGAWAELQPESLAPRGRVQVSELSREAASVTATRVRDAVSSPTLVSAASRLLLAFRDHRGRARKTGLYVLPLAASLQPLGQALRVARADGVAQPAARACAGSVVLATPRSFAGDYFVGVLQLEAALDRRSGEQQFYEDSHEFAQAAVACAPSGAQLIIAERGLLGRSAAALRSVSFGCRP